ncbi:DUF3040 domain-containing protein [Catellatospora bangladeshensis]|uniref:DUF3040 domain-containing protein n=1 Tax=Catellatospora bangladeshensis TaxID=310355 RepID=A0A8J3JPH1_9ACTN|nr:DUF3040 domain-containing protein [Catellatospora bangladeshensis]GIF84353.1 hypothetical protein Cba03nite_57020 [Catellatospora bangladeshensis]
MSLRPDEQELLAGLAEYTRASDPAFVAGLSNGVALAPVEYRRRHLARFGAALAAAGAALALTVLAIGGIAHAPASMFRETTTSITVRR